MRRVCNRSRYFGFRGDVGLGRKFGVVRGCDPTIAAASDSFNEDRVLGGIVQSVAKTIDGADDATIKIHVYALGPEGLPNVFPAKNFIRPADQQLQSLERQFLNLDLDPTLA